MLKNLFSGLLLFITFFTSVSAQTKLSTRLVAQSLNIPWEMRYGKDGDLWITERPGMVSRINITTGEKKVLLIISDTRAVGESGLLGFDFHPDFPIVPYVYFAYTYLNGNQVVEKLVRYSYQQENDTLTDSFILLDGIRGANIHNGARVVFGPDGKIYMSTGDAAAPALSLDMNSLNGKILRINEDGSIPNDNPFPNSYIYSFGHRNPQGLFFAPNGTLYSSEHGPNSDDEVNVILAGRHYGWPRVNGFCDDDLEQLYCQENNVKEPMIAWSPTIAPSTIIYYNHDSIPEWKNSLLMVTMNRNGRDIRALKLNEAGDSIVNETIHFDQEFGRIRAMCSSPNGRLYIATSNREPNGSDVVQRNDDRIIEIFNPNFTGRNATRPNITLTVYPIPSEEGLFKLSEKRDGIIYDLAGKETLRISLSDQINMNHLPKGHYILKTDKGEIIKLIK